MAKDLYLSTSKRLRSARIWCGPSCATFSIGISRAVVRERVPFTGSAVLRGWRNMKATWRSSSPGYGRQSGQAPADIPFGEMEAIEVVVR